MMLMLLQLARRRPCSVTSPSFFSAAQHSRRCYSSPTTQNPSFMVDYLINSCGVSPDKAPRISKHVAHLKSPERPDAVLGFLNQHGFSKADIARLITWHPDILCSSVENTLEPNLCALRDMGVSGSTIIQIILSSPSSLHYDSNITVPRIKFWMDFLGSDEALLVRVLKQNRGLIGHDITRLIAPRISLLQSHGLSAKDIQRVVCRPSIIMRNISVLEDMLNRAKDLGFHPSSGMFVIALEVMGCITREELQKKMDLFKSFGWSEDEFLCALRKQPYIVSLTNQNLRVKMIFLLGEARCDISYITSHPYLLSLSLSKRLRPRVQVIHLLASKGLSIPTKGLYTLMKLTNTEFVDTYILPYKDEIPELCEICEKLK